MSDQAAAASPAAPTSFMEAATMAASAAPTPDAAPAPTPTAAEPAPQPQPAGTPAAPAAAAAAPAPEWWKGLGAYGSEADVRTALAERETLRANQLTDDHKTLLSLSSDPDKWREFHQLTHTDYKGLGDEEVLLEAFRQANPGETEENLRFLFEEEQDKKYPGLADEPDTQAHKAHASKRSREAAEARERLTKGRDERLEVLKKGALPAPPADDAAQGNQMREQHLSLVESLMPTLREGGYKFTVDANGTPLNLAVEGDDLAALQAAMESPLSAIMGEDKQVDPEKLKQVAAYIAFGPKLLAAAYQAGRQGGGPSLPLAELHNADGAALPPVAGQPATFGALASAAFGPATKPNY